MDTAGKNDKKIKEYIQNQIYEDKIRDLLLGTNHELKNRYMHIDCVDENTFQSAKSKVPKCQNDTLECTLEELAVSDLIKKNPSIRQTELAEQTAPPCSSRSLFKKIRHSSTLYL